MTTVDGGALVCKSRADCERGRLLRWYGINRKDQRQDLRCEADIAEYGYKFHMNDVTATIGLEQLKYVAETLAKHRRHAARFDEALGGLQTVHRLRYAADRWSSYWLYTIRVRDRAAFMAHMKDAGVTVSQVHARNDLHTTFKEFRASLPGVEEFVAAQVSIPVGWWLTEQDQATIISAILDYERRYHPAIRSIAGPRREAQPTLTPESNEDQGHVTPSGCS